jgi:hypothetical protein
MQMPSLMQIPGMITTTQEWKTKEQRRRRRRDKKYVWESAQRIKVDIASMVGGAVKELSVSMNSTIMYRRTEQANSHKKWKVNFWLFAGLRRRELSPTAIRNMNRVVQCIG